jgi:hypothetical protein
MCLPACLPACRIHRFFVSNWAHRRHVMGGVGCCDETDQAERDVKCPVALAAYPCMERYLISSWRKLFNSSFAFVGVCIAFQLFQLQSQLQSGLSSESECEVHFIIEGESCCPAE